MKRTTSAILLGSGLSTLFPAMNSVAQDQPVLEEIFVVATRRVESIQDVPVSVASVSSETLIQTGAVDIADIAVLIPNFEFSSTGVLPNLYVRGIGTGSSHSVEQSVGRFLDDVYIGRAAANIHPVFDIQAVEVLRGPQGTLFGKNTLAGAVIINTGDPSQEFDFGLTTSVSSFSTEGGTTDVEGFINGALTDELSARVALKYRDRDGYIENLSNGPDGGAQEDLSGRVKLLWEPSDRTSVQLKVEHMTLEIDGQVMSEMVSGVFPGGPVAGQPIPEAYVQALDPSFTYDKDWQINVDCQAEVQGSTYCPGRDQDTTNYVLTLNHDFEGLGTFTSISAFQTYDFDYRLSTVDAGVVGGASRVTTEEEYDGFTQEFRFTSEESDTFDYILGAYFEDSQIDRAQRFDNDIAAYLTTFPPGALPPPGATQDRWEQDTRTIALFGQARYRFNDEYSLIAGLRWTNEEKDFQFTNQAGPYGQPFDPNAPADVDATRQDDRVVPSITLRYEPNDDMMLYASFSQGFKAGGFADRLQPDPEFDEELSNAYEIGMKATWLDGTLNTNLAIFRMDIEDLQVARSVFGTTNQFEVENAAEAVSQGVEFDFAWYLNDQWTIGGNLAYTDAEYDDYPNAVPTCTFAGTQEADGCNFEGEQLIFAPEWQGGAYIDFTQPNVLGGWTFNARTDFNYSSSFYTELTYNPNLKQESYELLDASIRMTSPDERFSLALIGRNLTEEYVITWGFTGGFTDLVAPRPPREIILQARFNY